MNEFKCLNCGRLQYSASKEKVEDPCIYCGGKTILSNEFLLERKPALVQVCSAYSGNIRQNTKNARRYCKIILDDGDIPFAPHLLFPQFLDENNPEDRKKGLELSLAMIERVDAVAVFGDINHISKGMQQEIRQAEKLNKPIRYNLGKLQTVLT